MNNYLLKTGKKYVYFLKIDHLINSMKLILSGIGIMTLFLIMLIPVYGEVTEFTVEKIFYSNEEKLSL